MSHTTVIDSVPITDLAALRSAVAELNKDGIPCSLKANHIPRFYYNASNGGRNQLKDAGYDQKEADLCLVLDNSRYDVAFMKKKDKSSEYIAVFDSWNNQVGKQIGANHKDFPQGKMSGQEGDIGKLMQLYTKHAVMNTAAQQGYLVESCAYDSEGQLQMTVTGIQ